MRVINLNLLRAKQRARALAVVSDTPFRMFFSRMRSKGSHFTLGVWGLRVCSIDVAFLFVSVRNRPQPSATVRNRAIAIWPCLW